MKNRKSTKLNRGTRKQTIVILVLNNFLNDSRVYKESLSLERSGYDVKVIAIWDRGLPTYETIGVAIGVYRVRLITMTLRRNMITQVLKNSEYIMKVLFKHHSANIYHCNDLLSLPTGVVISWVRKYKPKIVYDCHEYETETKGLTGFRKKIAKLVEQELIKRADKVITVNESIAKAYAYNYGIDKPVVVMNCPPYKNPGPPKVSLRKHFSIPDAAKVFLYLGGLSSGRGIELILEVFQNIDDRHYWVVFMGWGPLQTQIQRTSKTCRNICHHRAVHPDQVIDVASTADFGLSLFEHTCLNHYYATPNKLFEYIMAGLPVLVSNIYEQRTLVEREGIGLVVPEYTSDSLMNTILSSVTLNMQIIQKRENELAKTLSWKVQEQKLLAAYRDLSH